MGRSRRNNRKTWISSTPKRVRISLKYCATVALSWQENKDGTKHANKHVANTYFCLTRFNPSLLQSKMLKYNEKICSRNNTAGVFHFIMKSFVALCTTKFLNLTVAIRPFSTISASDHANGSRRLWWWMSPACRDRNDLQGLSYVSDTALF